MASEVVNFLPSEIARLVLGYLSDEGYNSSYKCFVKECPHLKEYLSLKRQGLNYPLLVNGQTLNQMLQEYAQFKLADTQKRQMMGVSALWSQLDAVVRTLKGHTACKQNQRVDGMTQASRTRRQIQLKKRRQQMDRLQKKRDLCRSTPVIPRNATLGRASDEKERGIEISDTDLSDGMEQPPEAGNCGVLTPPTDSETKGIQGRGPRVQADCGRRRETDNRETELILHSAPPSVSSHHQPMTFHRSSSISNLLNLSSQRLQNIRPIVQSRAETSTHNLVITPEMESRNESDSGAIQFNSVVSQMQDHGVTSSQKLMSVGIQESQSADLGGNNCDISMHEQSEAGCDQVILTMDDSTTKAVTSISLYSQRNREDEPIPNLQTQTSSGNSVRLKPSSCEDDPSSHIQVLGSILSGLPVVESLQSSSQSSASSREEVKGQGESGQEVISAPSSEENSQDSAETGRSVKTPEQMNTVYQDALDLPVTVIGSEAPRTPVKVVDECSQMSLGRTPRRKRLPRQKKEQRKGSGNLNDSNKTEENSLLMENITLFLNEFLNNPSLHERLAENINRTLSQRTSEKRSRKKSGRVPKTPASPKPSKPGKSGEAPIPEESESNFSQSMDTQHLNTFLDDILNINETQMTEAQIGGIIELTSKDPNFESLFHLFQEPHLASENQRTDFSGIGLEMGKEASVNNSSLPSFTEPLDCPEPSNTTSEENLIMEILQSPQSAPSHSTSYPRGLLDQTTESQKTDKGANSTGMEWTPCQTENRCVSTSTARNIFESFQNVDDSDKKVKDLVTESGIEETGSEQQVMTKVSENTNDGECEQQSRMLPGEILVKVTLGQSDASYQQLSPCPAVTAVSGISTISEAGSTGMSSQAGPVFSLISSVRPCSGQQEFKPVGSPVTVNSIVPCQSPQVMNSVPNSQEVLCASSTHPFTKLTEKVVSVSCDIPKGRTSVVQSPVHKAVFTNQPLSPLQVSVTKTMTYSPRPSSPNCVASSPCSLRENRIGVASPAGNSRHSSKFTENSPPANINVQATESHSVASPSIARDQRPEKCSEMESPILCSPSQPRWLKTVCNAKKTSQESSSQPKAVKPQKKGKSASSKKKKDKVDKLSSELSKEKSDADLVETFETSVTESDGFPVISIKSVMKSPQEINNLQADTVPQKIADMDHKRMSYQSFISGVTGECSTPMAAREGSLKSPHTSHNSGTSNEVLSEMIELVSSMEKSVHDDSSIEKKGPKDDNGKRNCILGKKVNKKKDTKSHSPPQKLQWSPDLKALLKLVTPEKKSKDKKIKKVVLMNKRRNPRRKGRRSNEENITKSDARTELSSSSPMQNRFSTPENMSEVNTKVITKSVSQVMTKTGPEVITKTGSEVTRNDDGNNELSMPSIHAFMSPLQDKSLGINNGSAINSGLYNGTEEGGLTPKTVMTAVLALKDNSKTSTRKSLSLPNNPELDTLELKSSNTEQNLSVLTSKNTDVYVPSVLCAGATSEPKLIVRAENLSSSLENPEPNSCVQAQSVHSSQATLEPSFYGQSPNVLTSQASLEQHSNIPDVSGHNIEAIPEPVATSEKGSNQDKEKVSVSETDYNKILYSPNRDFLDSPPRYQRGPGVSLSNVAHIYGNVISTAPAQQFDGASVTVSDSSQMNTPVESVCGVAYQDNPVVVSNTGFSQSHPNTVYSNGISYIQSSGASQDQAVTYSTVYMDDNGLSTVLPASSDLVELNAVPVSVTMQDGVPAPTQVTDILSAAAAVITSSPSPLKTVDSYSLNSTPEEKRGSVGQLIAIPVGRYYPDKKLHVRSLDFGPEAGAVEIRKPGYGRGHKKKSYNISSPLKPGGLAKKQTKTKGKSKGVSKGKAKTDNDQEGSSVMQGNGTQVGLPKRESCPSASMFDEDDLIPDASGSVYIMEGNTRKKIKLHKTPRMRKTASPFILPMLANPSTGIVPVRSDVPRKAQNKMAATAQVMLSMPLLRENADCEADSDVDVDGDCELPDLSPEPARHDTPKSKCLEMVHRAEFVTPNKSSMADYNFTRQPSSSKSISDSCDSNSHRLMNTSTNTIIRTGWMDSKGNTSNPSSVKSLPERPVDCFSNNSNSLPDLHSPRPFINMSTPPKKRITASLKHGGGCYFFSSSSQEGKIQSKVDSLEKDTSSETRKVSRSPRTPKGKHTPIKGVRQSPRLLGSPNRVIPGMSTPSKQGTWNSPSKRKGVKRLREATSGEQSKPEKKSKKARNGKRTVDLSKVDFEKFLDKIHK